MKRKVVDRLQKRSLVRIHESSHVSLENEISFGFMNPRTGPTENWWPASKIEVSFGFIYPRTDPIEKWLVAL